MSLIEKIARAYAAWREQVHMIDAIVKPSEIAFEAGYRAALTAIMGEGDGVQFRYEPAQGQTIEEMRANLSRELHSKGDAVLVWINEGDLTLADIAPATAAAAERARIVAWLRGHEAFSHIGGKFMADAIERGEV